MKLQGSLQSVFDVLYGMGLIDPLLKKDWVEAYNEIPLYRNEIDRAITTVCKYQNDFEKLTYELSKFDEKILEFLAIEVAQEYVGFYERKSLQ